MTQESPLPEAAQPEHPPHYCGECGEIFSAEERYCSTCGHRWSPPALNLRAMAAVLEDLGELRRRGAIDTGSYAALRRVYETRLARARPPEFVSVPAAPVPAAAAAVAQPAAELPAPPAPPRPRGAFSPFLDPNAGSASAASVTQTPTPTVPRGKPLGVALGEWTAARQADILLYLGAFLLSIAALIFVGYQGEALSGPARFAILVAYTAAFFALGILLRRWARVREASAVFLALGAILVPINFIALRTQVLDRADVPTDVIVLAGAAVSAALYITLALRGFGRFYAVPGVAAALVAWGALGSVLNLPGEWFGTWFVAAAAAALSATVVVPAPARRGIEVGAYLLGCAGLLYAHAAAGFGDTAQLPVAYGLATAGVASGIARRSLLSLALLPALAALTGLTACWSAFGMGQEWYGVFVAAAALGYLVVASFDQPARTKAWMQTFAALAAGAIVVTHTFMVVLRADRTALPATYALVLAGAVALYARWRERGALATIPLLGASLGAGALWAEAAMPLEWVSAWVALAAVGYILIAEFDGAYRENWRYGALAAGGAALVLAHFSAIAPATEPAQLPLTYGLLLAGALWEGARRRDTALGVIPPLAVGFGASLVWATADMRLGWLAIWIALAAPAYLAIAELDADRRTAWRQFAAVAGALALIWAHGAAAGNLVPTLQLPAVYGVLLAGSLWDSLRRRDTAMVAAPPLAAGLGATAGWAFFSMPLAWLGPWIAGAGLGYLALAEIDHGRLRLWRRAAGVSGGLALCVAHSFALWGTGHAFQLPLTYALVLCGAIWDGARRRDVSLAGLPVLGAMLAGTLLWALDVPPRWWIYPGLAASALILATEPWWSRRPDLQDLGRPYLFVSVLALPPLFMPQFSGAPVHGLAAFTLSAAIALAGAFRIPELISRTARAAAEVLDLEDATLLVTAIAGAYLYLAAGYFNASAGLLGGERAWVYSVIGSAAWIAFAPAVRFGRRSLGVLAAAASAGHMTAFVLAVPDPRLATLVLTIATAGTGWAFVFARRWPLLPLAAAFVATAIDSFWAWQGLDRSDLPLVFAVIAALLSAGLTPIRRYQQDERGVSVAALTWGPWGLALGASAAFLSRAADDLAAGEVLAQSRAWAVMTIIAAATSTAVVLEGLRLRNRHLWLPGTSGLLASALCAIAILQPVNVQAYTLLAGAYLMAIGLSHHRSWRVLGGHLSLAESVLIAGMLLVVLPPAEQSFAPGGGVYGLELIAFGLLFLVVGLLLTSRWLVAGGVLTLSGVALRWLFIFGSRAPYWLTLGVVGTALLALGLLLLFERDRWQRVRDQIMAWWIRSSPEDHIRGVSPPSTRPTPGPRVTH